MRKSQNFIAYHKKPLKKTHEKANNSTTLNFSLSVFFIRHAQVFLSSLGRLWRQPGSSLMTASVIGITLAFPTGLFIFFTTIQTLTSQWNSSAQITLYLKHDIKHSQALLLTEKIKKTRHLTDIINISSQQALDEFKTSSEFGKALNIIENNPLPETIIIHLNSEQSVNKIENLQHQLEKDPMVDIVDLDLQWIKKLHAFMNIAKRTIVIISFVLTLAVIIIIGNTIRLDIHNRHAEIKITKLIGATNTFIRRPFLYTGFWYGFFGGLITLLILWISDFTLSTPIDNLAKLYHLSLKTDQINSSLALNILIISSTLGLVGAWISVNKHLSKIEPN